MSEKSSFFGTITPGSMSSASVIAMPSFEECSV
jgi:hypothetical protein